MALSGRRCRSIVVWTIAVACAVSGRATLAQQYASIEPKVQGPAANALGGKVATILRDAAGPSDAAKKDLDAFFKDYLYRSMTSVDPVELGKLGQKREQLFTRYINTAKAQGVHDYINDITLKPMISIAKGNYHPAVRYNAVLIVSQLDQQTGAKPLPAATDALLTFLENDQFNNAPVPTPVKLAALIGLQRHLRLGLDPALNDRITKAALAVVNREKAPEDVSAKTYGWVRRQAAQVLALQSAKGLTPPVHDALMKLVSDGKIDLDDRCETAKLLQAAMYKDAKGLDGGAMTMALGELARSVLNIELKDAQTYQDKLVANPGMVGPGGGGFGFEGRGGPGGGMDFAMASVEDTTPHYEKRKMIDRTLAIAVAADAVAAGGSDEVKARGVELAKTLRTTAESIAAEERESAVSEAVIILAGQVDQLVGSWGPQAKPAPAAQKPGAIELPAEAPADAAG
jgi:hypothetical protein